MRAVALAGLELRSTCVCPTPTHSELGLEVGTITLGQLLILLKKKKNFTLSVKCLRSYDYVVTGDSDIYAQC